MDSDFLFTQASQSEWVEASEDEDEDEDDDGDEHEDDDGDEDEDEDEETDDDNDGEVLYLLHLVFLIVKSILILLHLAVCFALFSTLLYTEW